ncbi:probable peptide chain release factor C12orf65, mitochondrial [Cimex lectularius]|uniref:Prokaryotic-type class I peptide chain release factors domain-containing protein n=1 Tax=Cimex lectularius TaxID=79782 RepID=A0A8I6SDG7_CIMLE|nr:probable peptide chain release factor C12orf65, mitochondrial [Cimex lectularius]
MIALRWLRYFSTSSGLNTKISKLVPPVKEEDLSEQFVKGSGPGGQNVNKNTNCVVLKHLPTASHFEKLYSLKAPIRLFSSMVDKSLVPVLNEDELEERFVRGSGPGGSNVNKNSNCVVLKHVPTGIVVKCHFSRLLRNNRKLAREKLVTKLDNLINGEKSVENQLRLIYEKKKNVLESKKRKLRLLKEKWKEKEGL